MNKTLQEFRSFRVDTPDGKDVVGVDGDGCLVTVALCRDEDMAVSVARALDLSRNAFHTWTVDDVEDEMVAQGMIVTDARCLTLASSIENEIDCSAGFGSDELSEAVRNFGAERFTVCSSHGEFELNKLGFVVGFSDDKAEAEFSRLDRADLAEWREYWNRGLEDVYAFDILDLGFWTRDGSYEEPEMGWRVDMAAARADNEEHADSRSKTINELAEKFVECLRDEIGEEKWRIIVDMNSNRKPGENWCVSHDFCDANQVMIDAFTTVFGRLPEIQMDLDTDLINAAWDKASEIYFRNHDVKSDGDREEDKPESRAEDGGSDRRLGQVGLVRLLELVKGGSLSEARLADCYRRLTGFSMPKGVADRARGLSQHVESSGIPAERAVAGHKTLNTSVALEVRNGGMDVVDVLSIDSFETMVRLEGLRKTYAAFADAVGDVDLAVTLAKTGTPVISVQNPGLDVYSCRDDYERSVADKYDKTLKELGPSIAEALEGRMRRLVDLFFAKAAHDVFNEMGVVLKHAPPLLSAPLGEQMKSRLVSAIDDVIDSGAVFGDMLRDGGIEVEHGGGVVIMTVKKAGTVDYIAALNGTTDITEVDPGVANVVADVLARVSNGDDGAVEKIRNAIPRATRAKDGPVLFAEGGRFEFDCHGNLVITMSVEVRDRLMGIISPEDGS